MPRSGGTRRTIALAAVVWAVRVLQLHPTVLNHLTDVVFPEGAGRSIELGRDLAEGEKPTTAKRQDRPFHERRRHARVVSDGDDVGIGGDRVRGSVGVVRGARARMRGAASRSIQLRIVADPLLHIS